jgi:hypothetical protein
MRMEYHELSRSRINSKSAGARVTTVKAVQSIRSKTSLLTKSGDVNQSAFAISTPSLLPASSPARAITGLAKMIQNARKGGTLKHNLERRIDAIQAITILILNAKAEEVDNLLSFDSKTDDGKIKSFGRGVANLLRSQAAEEIDLEQLTYHELHLDVPRHKITVKNNPVTLTSKEFKLLALLAQRRGRVQSRERLLRDAWEYEYEVDTRTVDTHIRRLRQKLGSAGKYIETVHGFGYCFPEN